ncbi:MAG TPA: DUF4058 family protein [Gemmataceae bacterium]|jgi:hypothetical protein|nr:DUF4058 family protein [Gemmataceae bacterium]
MPLLDHFHPPIDRRYHWESFHSNWATRLADGIGARLPEEFQVEEHCHAGTSLEIDIATFQEGGEQSGATNNGLSSSTKTLATWTPSAALYTMPAVFPDCFEVRVFSTMGGLTLVGAIELISPANKDRPDTRRAFSTKCAGYLYRGVSLVIIDIVTSRKANLHNETLRLMEMPTHHEMPGDTNLYAVAYRPVLRDSRSEIDVWPVTFSVGDPLPAMPLRLTGDLFIPVDFEGAYQEACQRRRIT